MNDKVEKTEGTAGEIVLYQPDESITMEVRLEQETVWLTQTQMAELFKSTKQNISLHINNIYKEEELTQVSTVKDYLTVQTEGGRTVKRTLRYYNLDVIISVGYRVKSHVGTRFRQWANQVLKQHLLNGYSINRHLIALQQQVDSRFEALEHRVDEQQQQVEFLVDMHRQPEDRLFPTGLYTLASTRLLMRMWRSTTSSILP